MSKQDDREIIVLTVAAMLAQIDTEADNTKKLIALDRIVCDALDIDFEQTPPEYILPH